MPLPNGPSACVARAWRSILVAALSLALGSCGKEDETGKGAGGTGTQARGIHVIKAKDPQHLKFALVINRSNDFWKIVGAGARQYAKDANVAMDVKTLSDGTAEAQNEIITELARGGYDGIAISSMRPDSQIARIDEAAKLTNVICFDSDCPKSKRLVYIGTDNVDAGRVLGRQVVKLLPHGGKIAVFVGRFSSGNAQARLEGIQESIREHGIEIVAKREDDTDPRKAAANVEDVIATHENVNLLCGLWSHNGPAIAAGIERSGKKGQLLAAVFDEHPGTLAAIKDGVIQCTVVQKPFQFGYLSGRWMQELALKGDAATLPEDGNVDTGVRVIDPTSVAEFEKELAAMRGESARRGLGIPKLESISSDVLSEPSPPEAAHVMGAPRK